MANMKQLVGELVAANRILANENIVDAYGHVSMRHPDDPGKFLLSRSRSPELVEPEDIMTFTLDGKPADGRSDPVYFERFIHCGAYELLPHVNAVVHSHARSVLPFTISSVRMKPVIHTASPCGCDIPVWDIEDNFGATNLLVANIDQGRDLAKSFKDNRAVLMRGHGFTAVGRNLAEVLRVSVYLPVNAQVMMDAIRLGGTIKCLSDGEIDVRESAGPEGSDIRRAMDYWARRAGASQYLDMK